MFKSIKIKNLRAITELEINDLGQVNLLVGQNNCGKTTVLEAVFFLSGATNPQLPVTANNLRGFPYLGRDVWSTFFHNRKILPPIELCGFFQGDSKHHQLTINAKQESKRETQVVSSDYIAVNVERAEAAIPFIPTGLELKYVSSTEPEKKVISSVVQKGKEILFESPQQEVPISGYYMNPSTLLTDVKGQFGVAQRKKQVPQLITFLREIDSDISDLRLNEIGILEAEIGLAELIPVNLMGGGIAKYLSIALAMFNYQDGVVLIDEIENGLHHSAQQKLWKAVFSWSRDLNVQVFATTHSNECITAFKDSVDSTLFESEAKLFRIERKDEKFRAVEYTKDILSESLESDWEVR